MEIQGDAEAIDQLKQLTKESKEFFKFLLSEAQTNSSATADFKGKDGKHYVIKVNTVKGVIDVQPKPAD